MIVISVQSLLIASATIRNAETNGMSSVKRMGLGAPNSSDDTSDPAPRGEGAVSPVELVVVTRRELCACLDRLSELLGRVPDDRLIAELRRRGINYL